MSFILVIVLILVIVFVGGISIIIGISKGKLNLKTFFIISCLTNLVFAVVIGVLAFMSHQEKKLDKEKFNSREQVFLREYIQYQQAIKTSLKSSIKNKKGIETGDLLSALTEDESVLCLNNGVITGPIPIHIRQFHKELYGYLYQLSLRKDRTETDVKHIQIIIDTLNKYEKVVKFNYYDSPSKIETNLEQADEKVISPFLNSKANPF